MEIKEPDPSCTPRKELTAGRGPDRREAARYDHTYRTLKEASALRFQLANTFVFVSESPVGYIARIIRGDRTEYGLLAPATLDALGEVARA